MASDKTMVLVGRILTGVVGLGLVASSVMKIVGPDDFLKQWAGFGLSNDLALPIAIVEFTCALLFLLPKTSMLGALLVVGYLGGATLTHLRVGDPFIIPVIMGVVAVAGLWLREPRLRALLPLRS